MAGSFVQELKRRNVFRVAAIYVVVSWLLMQIADVMFPALLLPEWAPTLLIAFLILGFPLALVFAWAFELTPDGVVRTVEVPEEQSITATTGHRLNYTIIGMLAIAVVFLLVKDIFFDERPAIDTAGALDKSIAVLPFKNQSASAENAEFFAGGLHDELLTMLSRLGELKVISRTSVERLDPNLSIPEIGQLLGVATVLEGQVQRAGDRLRINVQLIDTAEEGHIWANTYDSELTATNIFEVQGDIARTIADALHAKLSPEEQEAIEAVPTRNTAALENYLMGVQLKNRRSYAALEEAKPYLKEAIRLDPEFAEAWVALADTYGSQASTGAISSKEYLDGARSAVAAALEYGPELPEAHTQQAMLLWSEGDTAGAERAFRKALEIDPRNSMSLEQYGFYLRVTNRLEEARDVLKRSLETDPLSTESLFQLGKVEMYLGDASKNLSRAARILEIDPSSAYAPTAYIQAHLWTGRYDLSWQWFLKSFDNDPNDFENWAHVALHSEALGFPDLADRYLAKALELGPGAPAVLKCQAIILLNRNRFEEALVISRAALQARLDDRWGSLSVFMRVVRDHGIDAGKLDEASRYYEQHVPGLFAGNPQIDSFSIQFAADLAGLFQAAGQSERAMALIQAALAWHDATQPDGVWGFVYNIIDVELHALAGHREEALRLLAAAIDYGWRTDASFVINNKNLDSIADDEEFRRLVAVIDADLAEQHKTVEKMPPMGEYDLRSN